MPLHESRRTLLAVLLTFVPTLLAGQTVSGEVRDALRQPVAGAVVTLRDPAAHEVSRGLTGSDGRYRLRAPTAGRFTLRVARVGFAPWLSAEFALNAGEVRRVDATVSFIAVNLGLAHVRSRSSCRRLDDSQSSETLARWEQARTALSAAQVIAQSRDSRMTTFVYDRAIVPGSRRVLTQRATIQTDSGATPWRARSVQALRAHGYVERRGGDTATYFAPDLAALLSPEFLEDHCVRVVEGRDSAETGVAFAPTQERRAVTDIAGTIWLTRTTGALRRIEFRYVAPRGALPGDADGDLHFAPLANGGWAIVRWEVRVPQAIRRDPNGDVQVLEQHANGGQLVLVMQGTDTLWISPLQRIAGQIVDSSSGVPIRQARIVRFIENDSIQADADGRFVVERILPGRYELEIATPSLDSVGVTYRLPMIVLPTTNTLRLDVPTAAQLGRGLCGPRARLVDDSSGVVFGVAMSSAGVPVERGALVAVDWTDHELYHGSMRSTPRYRETLVDSTGSWRVCGVPRRTPLSIRVASSIGRAPTRVVQLGRRDAFRRVDVEIASNTMAGGSVLGQIVDADSATYPISAAVIELPDMTTRVQSSARGEFVFDEVSPGRLRFLIRRTGYQRVALDTVIEPNRVLRLSIPMTRDRGFQDRAPAIDAAKEPSEFEQHRREGRGQFLTRADLDNNARRSLHQLALLFHGAAVQRGRRGRAWLSLEPSTEQAGKTAGHALSAIDRRDGAPSACYAHVFVDDVVAFAGGDGALLFDLQEFTAEQLEGVEFYKSAVDAPRRFQRTNASCGILVLWTRGLPPGR